MRKITFPQIATFATLLTLSVLLGGLTSKFLFGALFWDEFRGVLLLLGTPVFAYPWAFLMYRLFLHFVPLQEGELAEGSRAEFAAQVHILFHLMVFNSLICTHFLPVPMKRLVLQSLGARMGPNTYSAGTILDPLLTELGANSIVGHDAVLFSHVIEGRRLALYPIRIGNNVTIGAKSVVMPGVSIADGAIVSAGSVVPKDTRIGPGEVWGGVPAKRLR